MGFVDFCDVATLGRLIEEIDKIEDGFEETLQGKVRRSQRRICKRKLKEYYDLLDWAYIKDNFRIKKEV
jgi:hypothetical protein